MDPAVNIEQYYVVYTDNMGKVTNAQNEQSNKLGSDVTTITYYSRLLSIWITGQIVKVTDHGTLKLSEVFRYINSMLQSTTLSNSRTNFQLLK